MFMRVVSRVRCVTLNFKVGVFLLKVDFLQHLLPEI